MLPCNADAKFVNRAGVVVDRVGNVAAVEQDMVLGGPVPDLAVDLTEVLDALEVMQKSAVAGHGVLARVVSKLVDPLGDLRYQRAIVGSIQLRMVSEERLDVLLVRPHFLTHIRMHSARHVIRRFRVVSTGSVPDDSRMSLSEVGMPF